MAYTRLVVRPRGDFLSHWGIGSFSCSSAQSALNCALADVFFSVATLYFSRPEPYPNSVIIKFSFD
jgi:hypothetical protein